MSGSVIHPMLDYARISKQTAYHASAPALLGREFNRSGSASQMCRTMAVSILTENLWICSGDRMNSLGK